MRKLALIGLDCADPNLIESFLPDLPTLGELIQGGCFGRLRSVDPPITIPAWMCMMTGKDPGELGVYGFRNRIDHSYTGLMVASSASFQAKTVWDVLGRHGFSSIILGIPGTFPPRPIRGLLVSGFPVPDNANYTYPAALQAEVHRWVGEYMPDVPKFRTDDKSWLLKQVRVMTERRFALARRLISEKEWDFFALVEMGPDRIHHAFWAQNDDPQSQFRDALRGYYKFLDKNIADLLSALPRGTSVLVVSDHGAQRMEGGIGLNEWLVKEGYLVLNDYPAAPTRIGELIREGQVDWRHTAAWGEGGYYGRVFLNVVGREPQGSVPPDRYEELRAELAQRIVAIPDEHGCPIGTRAFRPEELYRQVRGIPPDLIVYFGNLAFRSLGTVGRGRVHFHDNDTGPDDANHAPYGIFIAHPKKEWVPSFGTWENEDRSLLEVRDWILRYFGIEGDTS